MDTKMLINLIEKAKRQYDKAKDLEDRIFKYFNDLDIDLSNYKGGCNSDTLQDMITCYLMYGDDSINDIKKRLKEIEGDLK